MSDLSMMTFGLVLFVAGSATAMRFAAPVPSESTTRVALSGRLHHASESGWLRGVRSSTQLGPDPEQVIGRQTGART